MVEADIMRAPVVIASVAALTLPSVRVHAVGSAQAQTATAVASPKLGKRPWSRRPRRAR